METNKSRENLKMSLQVQAISIDGRTYIKYVVYPEVLVHCDTRIKKNKKKGRLVFDSDHESPNRRYSNDNKVVTQCTYKYIVTDSSRIIILLLNAIGVSTKSYHFVKTIFGMRSKSLKRTTVLLKLVYIK